MSSSLCLYLCVHVHFSFSSVVKYIHLIREFDDVFIRVSIDGTVSFFRPSDPSDEG